MRPSIVLPLLALTLTACALLDAPASAPLVAPTVAVYVAPSVTPAPPPTWTPHVQMTEQAVAATAIYLQAERQRLDHAARLYAITEDAARLVAASAETEAAARAHAAIAERDRAYLAATATAGVIRERATADTAYIRTALPPMATAVYMQTEAAGMERVAWTAASALMLILAVSLPAAFWLWFLGVEKRRADDHAYLKAQREADLEAQRAKTRHLYGAPAPAPAPIISQPAPAPEVLMREVRRNGAAPLTVYDIANPRERCWRLAGARLLEWAARQGGISQADMVGPGMPLSSAEDWQIVTDFLAQNGIIVKRNGARTRLSAEYDSWHKAAARLLDGAHPVIYDRERDPVPINDPATDKEMK